MSGIYIHIPFCRQACSYCDFYFSTHLNFKDSFLKALKQEMAKRKEFIQTPVQTVYFGGGTPSQLSVNEIKGILDQLNQLFDLSQLGEITLEANPDDLTESYLKELSNSPVNRLSVGIQSFHDKDLKMLHRAHNGKQSYEAIQKAQDFGFEDLSLDLIYGLPGSTQSSWQQNLDKATTLDVPHISSYCLTVEPNTRLEYALKKGRLTYPSEKDIIQQFRALQETLSKAGYEHYEISNFAKPGKYAKHNTAYWQGNPHLGLGPSAHSFDGERRYWNLANTRKYVNLVQKGESHYDSEKLSEKDQYNEYLMTHLRTQWGVDLKEIDRLFGSEQRDQLLRDVLPFEERNQVVRNGDLIQISSEGLLLADQIAADLFITD